MQYIFKCIKLQIGEEVGAKSGSNGHQKNSGHKMADYREWLLKNKHFLFPPLYSLMHIYFNNHAFTVREKTRGRRILFLSCPLSCG